MFEPAHDNTTPPSREANPFATCWTRPGALPLVLPEGETARSVVARLKHVDWRGQVVGPHGSGKSTLLAHLAPEIERAGRMPILARVDQPDGAMALAERLAECDEAVALLEGFERLGYWRRRAILRACRKALAGWVATTHRRVTVWPEPLPLLTTLRVTEATVAALFNELTRRRPTPVTQSQALASFRAGGGDLRAVWFDLYDRHERLTRPGRTARVLVA